MENQNVQQPNLMEMPDDLILGQSVDILGSILVPVNMRNLISDPIERAMGLILVVLRKHEIQNNQSKEVAPDVGVTESTDEPGESVPAETVPAEGGSEFEDQP